MPKFDFVNFRAKVRYEAGEGPRPAGVAKKMCMLATLSGGEFLRRAYEYILRRETDAKGYKCYLPHTYTFYGRMRVALSLLLCDECETAPQWLTGLKKYIHGKRNNGLAAEHKGDRFSS